MGHHKDRDREDGEKKRVAGEGTTEEKKKEEEKDVVVVKKKKKKKKTNEKYHPPKDCATSGYERRIHNESVWKLLQDTYNQTVSPSIDKNHGVYHDKHHDKQQRPVSGFTVDVFIKDDNGPHGRGVYAAQPIEKGTKVWKPYHLSKIESQKQLFLFLQELDHDLQCDCLLWGYVERNHNHVSLPLDDGSFLNHGSKRKSKKKQRQDQDHQDHQHQQRNLDAHYYSTRDIKVDEELLVDYSEFIGFNELQWFDKIRGDAWKSKEVKEKIGQKSYIAKSIRVYNLFGSTTLSSTSSLTEQQHSNNNQHHQHNAIIIVLAVVVALIVLFMSRKLFPSLYRHRFVNINKKFRKKR